MIFDDENKQEVESPTQEILPQTEQHSVSPLEGESHQDTPVSPPSKGFKNESEERNFIAMRQLKQKAERERDEALRLLQQINNQQQQSSYAQVASEDRHPTGQPQQQKSGRITVAHDELVEGKHVQALQEEIERLRSEMTEYKQYSSTATAEARLKASYPDIDKVVNKENLELLAIQEPELHASIMSSPDFYAKGASAYKALKRFGIYQEEAYEPDKSHVHNNLNKPRPTNAISPQKAESPLSHANAFAQGLTPELKNALYKEMMENRKNF